MAPTVVLSLGRFVSKGLSQELRENCGYLRDGGWRNTAALMLAAANEIDRLGSRVKQLEEHSGEPRTVDNLIRRMVARRRHHRPR
jgi:hypothetical protein